VLFLPRHFFVYNFISLMQNFARGSAYCMQLNSSFATMMEEMKLQLKIAKNGWVVNSVADPGSRILIFTHPGSRIQKQKQKRGVKKNLLSYLFL
jgi:hypothetical protein